MHADCIFCDISQRNHPAEFLYESDNVYAIKDIMPKAPVHLLVIPKKHIVSINELTADDTALIGEMVMAAKALAEQTKIAEKGYKLIWNVGKEGGQIIPHLHLHILGGKQLEE